LRQILAAHLANGESSDLSVDEYIKFVIAQREQTQVLADGRIVAMRRQPMPDGGWIATHQDITELKRAETLLRTTLDTMDQGLIALDRDGRTTLMNTRVLELLGLPQQFAVSRPHKKDILAFQRRHRRICQRRTICADRRGHRRAPPRHLRTRAPPTAPSWKSGPFQPRTAES